MITTQTEFSFRVVPASLRTARAEQQPSDRAIGADLSRVLMVEPGSRPSLADLDPAFCGEVKSFEQAMPLLQTELQKLNRLQFLMHAEGKHSLLIVLQGMDAAGKDGVVRHILSGANPAGCRVVAFKRPSPPETSHDFLWRVHPHVPARGEMVVFNRSHYEDVLVTRVHHLVPPGVWSKRYRLINDFENLLATGNDTTVLKFFLHISKEEQLARFKRRLDDPRLRCKISEADYQEREHWDEYAAAFEEMLYRTSTWHAPWFIVPSNNKWFRDLAISQIISRTLEDLDMRIPEPAVDLLYIRRRYHAAEKDGGREPGSLVVTPKKAA